MYQTTLQDNSKCGQISVSSNTLNVVAKRANYNATGDIDGLYSVYDVLPIVKAYYEMRCAGWDFAPGTSNSDKVYAEIARRTGATDDKIRVFMYEWYYAWKRELQINDVPELPKAKSTTSKSTSSPKATTPPSNPSSDAQAYQTPTESNPLTAVWEHVKHPGTFIPLGIALVGAIMYFRARE